MSDTEYFHHPLRLPKGAPGPFYTIGQEALSNPQDPGSPIVLHGRCMQCLAPEQEAPELLAEINDANWDTRFVRQPETPDELEKAISALHVCCVCALRYGGRDRTIIARLNNDPQLCDYIESEEGELNLVVGPDGKYLPFAQNLIAATFEKPGLFQGGLRKMIQRIRFWFWAKSLDRRSRKTDQQS